MHAAVMLLVLLCRSALSLGFSSRLPPDWLHRCSSIVDGPGMLEGVVARACRRAHWCRMSSEAEWHHGRGPP